MIKQKYRILEGAVLMVAAAGLQCAGAKPSEETAPGEGEDATASESPRSSEGDPAPSLAADPSDDPPAAATHTSPEQAIRSLMEQFRKAAASGDYAALEPLIYPYRDISGAEHDTRAGIIEGVRSGRRRGDFAYSDQAMRALIDFHLPNLTPLPEELRSQLFSDGGAFGTDPTLAALAAQSPEDIFIIDHMDVHILWVKIDGTYRLLFWENLTAFEAGE